MATAVEICNSALIKVGAQRILSLTDANERARVMNEQYQKVRDELLYSHPWNFAIARAALSPVAAPEFGFSNAFQLPTDCLRVVETDLPKDAKWDIEGSKFVCNYSEVRIKYIKRSTDTSRYSAAFCEALSFRLAADIAYQLTQSTSLADSLWQKAEQRLALARTFDAQESQGDRVYSDTWLNARF